MNTYTNGLQLSINVPTGFYNVQIHIKEQNEEFWNVVNPENILGTDNSEGDNNILEPGDTSVMFDGLNSGTQYEVKIVGIKDGNVYYTNTINVTTNNY
ncbi:hypothetical protein [Lysinibacillus sp. JNUCC-52]|uniref:hypothetical protein n=1 Tax=Lysinibacillus sp. JNUCC-52 TaxID=2792480 RepID=UPI0019380D88|nr:hypothetical protein JNUCC52_03195 [Lysinibacillus sp. JNUCC-52]